MKNTKGLSAVITTLIIILLVLVAVGIVWVVVNNVLEEGSEQLEIGSKCLSVDIRATSADCEWLSSGSTPGDCNVTYTRNSGGDDVDGIRFILSDGLNSISKDVSGNVEIGATRTEAAINATGIGSNNVSSVEVAVYFEGSSGDKQFCSTTRTFENIGITAV